MSSHSLGVPKLVDRISEALFARIASGEIDRLDAVFSQWQPGHGVHIERARPVGVSSPGKWRRATAEPGVRNAPDCTRGRLPACATCNTALQAFAAENEARMEVTASARSQIERQLSTLQATQRIVRREEITPEVIELAAGETASRPDHAISGNVKRG